MYDNSFRNVKFIITKSAIIAPHIMLSLTEEFFIIIFII